MIEPFRDPAQPLAARVEDLLGRLTLREKVGQLNQRLLGWHAYARTPGGFVTTSTLDDEVERWGGLGALYGLQRADAWSGRDWATGIDPAAALEVAALVQKRVVAGSRLGIPALFVEEAPHGHQALGAQLFPTNLGTAATFRPTCSRRPPPTPPRSCGPAVPTSRSCPGWTSCATRAGAGPRSASARTRCWPPAVYGRSSGGTGPSPGSGWCSSISPGRARRWAGATARAPRSARASSPRSTCRPPAPGSPRAR